MAEYSSQSVLGGRRGPGWFGKLSFTDARLCGSSLSSMEAWFSKPGMACSQPGSLGETVEDKFNNRSLDRVACYSHEPCFVALSETETCPLLSLPNLVSPMCPDSPSFIFSHSPPHEGSSSPSWSTTPLHPQHLLSLRPPYPQVGPGPAQAQYATPFCSAFGLLTGHFPTLQEPFPCHIFSVHWSVYSVLVISAMVSSYRGKVRWAALSWDPRVHTPPSRCSK